MSSSEQFVPLISSLSDDAPGYNENGSTIFEDLGPLCWKCSGSGKHKSNCKICAVCQGSKRLPVKKSHLNREISTGSGHELDFASIALANLRHGEQLCGLVGGWQIIQRRQGHRWTTDDIVTAWVALKATKYLIPHIYSLTGQTLPTHSVSHYLDLGCGNGSILMMVAKHLSDSTVCIGVEARSEAVHLARRSIAHNLQLDQDTGKGNRNISVRHSDFRGIYTPASDTTTTVSEPVIPEGSVFDLITGSPPYFQVEFSVDLHSKLVESAVIRQGGMPTCKESAPARCEFRGGVEAYCMAAAAMLSFNGVFVVCENFLNHDRVLRSAIDAHLFVCSVQRVCGKQGRKPLFCVYTMIRQDLRDFICSASTIMPHVVENTHNTTTAIAASTIESAVVGVGSAGVVAAAITTSTIESAAVGVGSAGVVAAASDSSTTLTPARHAQESSIVWQRLHQEQDLVVRDESGAWTVEYAAVLTDMSYPVYSLHPSGAY